ncbi:gag-pol polyprotein [Cucumis melo var. makuwa]|uniref:Gag-pol polyprotein n=1 Tax=Cucumis melo var. makuwa TaxID=1194695 RepID=A0A5D3BKX4_CUCMM|nr:gag-pol polyprotein [Cucumis melo var. makuwa]
MEIIREGPTASRPPVLDVSKSEVDSTYAEEQASVGNARALNAIFNCVDLNVFKLINSCSIVKEAWRILEVAYEETSKVKISRLQNSRAYRLFNNRSETVIDTINVVVNDFEPIAKRTNDENDEAPKETVGSPTALIEEPKADINSKSISKDVTAEVTELIPSAHVRKNHPSSSIIGNPSVGITTRKKEKVDYVKMIGDLCYTFAIEHSSIDVALKDEYWINAMQEELLQFRHNNVWTLVPKPEGANIIGTKWVFKNKTDEARYVTRNKARFVAQGYAQVEGVNFDETFAPVARLEAIRLLLGLSCIRRFKLYQMNVKSVFLSGYLNEEVYVAQPKGFFYSEFPQHVYKLNKVFYGLKEASRT